MGCTGPVVGLLLLWMVTVVSSQDDTVQLVANKCSQESISILDVTDCMGDGKPAETRQAVWNREQFRKIDGFVCTKKRSRRYSYCGHYSVTKASQQKLKLA